MKIYTARDTKSVPFGLLNPIDTSFFFASTICLKVEARKKISLQCALHCFLKHNKHLSTKYTSLQKEPVLQNEKLYKNYTTKTHLCKKTAQFL